MADPKTLLRADAVTGLKVLVRHNQGVVLTPRKWIYSVAKKM
jgi:hypothetical protein